MADSVVIGKRNFSSRLMLGTGGIKSLEILREVVTKAGCEVATVAMRRVDLKESTSFLQLLEELNVTILPNTAGCFTANDAVLTARMAEDALGTGWVKLEVIGDEHTLLPDSVELLKAAEELVDYGIEVLAYTNDDVILAKRLLNLGVSAVMPLGSPIGSGLGIVNPHAISMIIDEIAGKVPVVLDAGIGTASDAAFAMELGCDLVLAASSITKADNPILMASSISMAVKAGRDSWLAGRIPKRYHAQASTSQGNIATWK